MIADPGGLILDIVAAEVLWLVKILMAFIVVARVWVMTEVC